MEPNLTQYYKYITKNVTIYPLNPNPYLSSYVGRLTSQSDFHFCIFLQNDL